jgi:hypothetical protein
MLKKTSWKKQNPVALKNIKKTLSFNFSTFFWKNNRRKEIEVPQIQGQPLNLRNVHGNKEK